LAPFGLSACPIQAEISSAARGSLEGRFGKAKPSMVTSAPEFSPQTSPYKMEENQYNLIGLKRLARFFSELITLL